jgi:hypothetical protein
VKKLEKYLLEKGYKPGIHGKPNNAIASQKRKKELHCQRRLKCHSFHRFKIPTSSKKTPAKMPQSVGNLFR